MSVIKSFAVGDGDMFYIKHDIDSFTIIDCFLNDENERIILNQVGPISRSKGITRFISTHPDIDHVRGLDALDAKIGIVNFYCVRNSVTKPEESPGFTRYCQLRDSDKAFYIKKGCNRKWLNDSDATRGGAGIHVLWPDINNQHFKDALMEAESGMSANNISAIIRYHLQNGASAIWFGDMHKDFMELIQSELQLSKTNLVFAPHHGRRTGRIPAAVLEKLSPDIIIIGEAATEHLDYYAGYNTITQNSAGDVIFECLDKKLHAFTSKEYDVDYLDDEGRTWGDLHYVGTLNLRSQ
jgi:beta-lactamase superfamily II metal-dependent hydrolase